MRWLPLFAAAAASVFAQTAPFNDAGVSTGHIHLVVPNAEVDSVKKAWADVLGATPTSTLPNGAGMTPMKLPGVFIIITGGNNTGGTNGTVVNHVGFLVKDYAAIKAKADAAMMPWRELTPNQQAFVTMPHDVTVEVQEDKTINVPVMFSHFHLSVPDQKGAQAWYIKEFGAGDGARRGMPAAMVPGGEVDFLSSAGRGGAPAAALVPTKGRTLDHIGFEVKDLDALAKKLQADGITMNMPVTDMQARIGLKIAFITDPNGTYIELTQGLNNVK